MTAIEDLERVRMVGSAYRKTGRPVALVALGDGVHAGHLALLGAARRIRGAVVVVAVSSLADASLLTQADLLWRVDAKALWPRGLRTRVTAPARGLEADLSEELTRLIALSGALRPTHVVVGEKDYELAVDFQHAVTDLHLDLQVRSVPTVRTPEGLAMSLRNTRVAPAEREKAQALSAALTAGAFAAEGGKEAVLAASREVLRAAAVEPEYLELRGRDLGSPPAEGDARLLLAARVGGVRLIDNVGLPLGIGFRNLESAQPMA